MEMKSFFSISIIDTVSIAVTEAGKRVLRPKRKSGEITDGASRVWLTMNRSELLRMESLTLPPITNMSLVQGSPAMTIFSPGRNLRNARRVPPTISDIRL